ncbi:uncharacterized protein DFL_003760 [Arthrobotrys flagrans]|uniref:Uncharacterized protein n=1 Tax=Arthrobotrys flagrans TaxID=97331 RepID=A0A437A2S3_ARTFL|nr:hypothetical protein DFL_003760 [Arthrobotrys flagrans]
MPFQFFTILLIFLGLAGTVPVPDKTYVDEELHGLKSREGGHQEYIVNLDSQSQPLWLEFAYGDAFSAGGVFTNPFGDNLKKYHTLKTVVNYMLHQPPTTWDTMSSYYAPHGKCKVLYCNGDNFGVSLCSRRQGDDAQVSLSGEAVGHILEEWMEAFKWQKAIPKNKTDGDFKTPIYGRSYWSEDPGWSVNIEECGNTFVNFEEDVAHDT